MKDGEKVCSVCGAPIKSVSVDSVGVEFRSTSPVNTSSGSGSAMSGAAGQTPSYPPLSSDASGQDTSSPSSYNSQAGRAPSYSPLSNEATRQAPAASSPGAPAAQAPIYSSLSNEPAQTSLFEAPSDFPASVGKFDFSWESEAFHNQDQRGTTEGVDFKWNVGQNRVIPPAAAVASAADEQANAAAARRREEASESIFRDDTFHLRTSAQEEARFAELKKNEEFQELLDQEFEKIKDRQSEIDEERSRINERIMIPAEPTPAVLVTGENARIAAEERIQEYLRRADREMREAMKLQAALKQQDIDAIEQELAPEMEQEPDDLPVPGLEAVDLPESPAQEPAYATETEPVVQSEAAPETGYTPEPATSPETDGLPASGPEASENFDPYESYGSDAFSAPGDRDQDTNVKAFGFNHKEGDVAWEREREDYDPGVSAITEDKDAEQVTSYLEGHPAGNVAEAPAPAPSVTETPGAPDIFITDFANPFAGGTVSAEPVPEPVTPVTPVTPEDTVRPEEPVGGIFDTSFANPFAVGAPLSQDTTSPAPDTATQYEPAVTSAFASAAVIEPESAVTPDFVSTVTPLYETTVTAEPVQPVSPASVAPAPVIVPEQVTAPEPTAPEQFVAPESVIAPGPAIAPGPTPASFTVPEEHPAPTQPITPEPVTASDIPIEPAPTLSPAPFAVPDQPMTPESVKPATAPGLTPEQPVAPEPATTPEPAATSDHSGAFTFEPKPQQDAPQSAEPQVSPVQGATQGAEQPIKPAPVTGATAATVSGRRHAPDIINKPVVFPFDEAPEKPVQVKAEPAKTPDDVFTVPEHKTPEAHKPVDDVPAEAAAAPAAAASATPPTTAGTAAPSVVPGTAEPAKTAGATPGATGSGQKKKEKASKSAANRNRPNRGIVALVDVLIVIVIILAAGFAIVQLAPDTGAAELIKKGASRFLEITGIANDESSAAEADAAAGSSSDEGYVMPISDGDTLISSQLYNNYNIGEVKYDPGASWEEGTQYSIEGASAAKPISDDHWSDGLQGPLLYDESAVAAVIRFDSGLVEYINQGNTEFLNTVAVGSSAEKKIAGYVASVSQLSFDSLGIGNIRKNGDDLYVWTNETVTETMDGAPVQRSVKRLYMLTPDVDTYKVSDYEDIG
jgi:hypothetical protein